MKSKIAIIVATAIAVMTAAYILGFYLNKLVIFPLAEITATDSSIHKMMLANIVLTLALKLGMYVAGKAKQ